MASGGCHLRLKNKISGATLKDKSGQCEKELVEQNKTLRRKVLQLTRQVARLRKQIADKQFELDDDGEDFEIEISPPDNPYVCKKCGSTKGKVIELDTPAGTQTYFFCQDCPHKHKIDETPKKRETNDDDLDSNRKSGSNRNRHSNRGSKV